MNSFKRKIAKILGGRVDFDIIEVDLDSLLSEVPHKDTSDTVNGDNITAEKVREWLKTLPEPTEKEMQDYLWHERS